MKSPVLLVIDDDELVIQAVRLALPPPWRMMACQNPDHVPESGFHAALVDMHLSQSLERREGLEVTRRLAGKGVEIVAMSGNLDRELMESGLKAGATRFLAKPLSFEEVSLTLSKVAALLELRQSPRWIGRADHVRRQIADLRGEGGPILIEGESGTGKEICAELLHAQEPLRPFVIVNVAGIPKNLFESELFGHVKGAFTGADSHKMGLAEAADGGDLFLDEIEALSPDGQAKLLRFLESGETRRIGATESITVRARVLAATNRDLAELVRAGHFREDLYYRLSGKRVSLPPLRERRADIGELARHFLNADVRRKELADDALRALEEHPWPGNVRELKRVCERIAVQAPLPVVRACDVAPFLKSAVPTPAPASGIELGKGLQPLVGEYEARIIEKALSHQNDIDDVARLLKISRSSLYKKIKDHGIRVREK